MTMFFDGRLIAHVHANWLAPVKVRRTLLGGSRRMIVFDDLEASEKIKVYDQRHLGQSEPRERLSDAHRLPHRRHVGAAARGDARRWASKRRISSSASAPARGRMTDGEAGLRVVRLLEAATASMADQGRLVDVQGDGRTHDSVRRSRSAQYRSIKPEIDAAVLRVLDSAQFILGPEVAAFEREFAAYCGTTEAIGVNSGTSALHLALLAAGVGPGDEVITVPFTFVATRRGDRVRGRHAGVRRHRPGLLDDGPRGIEAAITPRTKAIMPVHLYGQPADMDPILDIARRRGLIGHRGCAQAHGAEYKGRRCGSMGELGCFSFYPGQEPRRLRRGRRGGDERSGAGGEDPRAAELGRRGALRAQRVGVQLPDGRHPGRDPGRQAAPPGGVDRGAPARTPRTTRGARRYADQLPRRARRSAGTCITSTSCVCRTATPRGRRFRGRRPDAACTIRFPCTCSRRIADLGYDARRFPGVASRWRPRCCRCRCFPR